MKYIMIVTVVLTLIVAIAIISIYRNNLKVKQFLKFNYGKLPIRNYNRYDMESIASYWEHRRNCKNYSFAVDDSTWKDLNMDKIYRRINSTCSSIGEEYLYSTLHDQSYDEKKLLETEEVLKFFDEHSDIRLYAQFYLSKLGKVTSNGIVEFFFNPIDKKLRYYAVFPVLSIAAAISIVSFLLKSPMGIWPILLMAIINIMVYFKTKLVIETELVSVRYISSLLVYAQKLSGIKSVELKEYTNRLSELHSSVRKIGKVAGTILNKSSSDVDFLSEYVKMFFMLDFITYNRVISIITKHSKECIEIYKIVGFLDMAISVASYRRSVAYYSIPEFMNFNQIVIKDLIHPLISEPVANSIILKRSSLITGSNASGKSTFIKALAINTIFAQTIHTCLATSFRIKPSFVVTSMAISDNIEAGESYYIAEIKSLKRVLDGLNVNIRCLCFIDEILKGTNTIERIAASASIFEYLSGENCFAIVATHDIELTEMTISLFDNYHFQEHITDDGIDFDYKIYEGFATTKNAIQLLKFMDYNAIITTKANVLARDFEKNRVWRIL